MKSLCCAGSRADYEQLSHDCCQINLRHSETHTTITENILSITLTTLIILMRYAVRWYVSPTKLYDSRI
jgi:hypothetical protein